MQENESEDALSYKALNRELVRNRKRVVMANGYNARNMREFISVLADRSMSPPSKEADLLKNLKFHISLPENDPEQFALGWDLIKDILIEERVVFFKVVNENNQMSKSKLPGEELGSQRGKDVTIYAGSNSEFEAKDWIRIIKRVTKALADANIPPGYETTKEGARDDRAITGNPYFSYRYQNEDVALEDDIIAHSLHDVDWEIDATLSNIPWEATSPSTIEREKEKEIERSTQDEDQSLPHQEEEGTKKNCCNLG